jgi:chaperonin GroES
MKIRPMNGRVVLRPVEAAAETKGGIVIPDTAKEKPREGEVVAVAEDATEEVAVGDRVIYKEYGGAEVKVDDTTLILMETDELVAKYVATDKIPD